MYNFWKYFGIVLTIFGILNLTFFTIVGLVAFYTYAIDCGTIWLFMADCVDKGGVLLGVLGIGAITILIGWCVWDDHKYQR